MSIRNFNKLLILIWMVSLIGTAFILTNSYNKTVPLRANVKALIELNQLFHNLSILSNEIIFYPKKASEKNWLATNERVKEVLSHMHEDNFSAEERYYINKLKSLTENLQLIYDDFHAMETNHRFHENEFSRYRHMQASNLFSIAAQMNKIITTIKIQNLDELERREYIIKVLITSIVGFNILLAIFTFFFIWRKIVSPLTLISEALHSKDTLISLEHIPYDGKNEIGIIVQTLNDGIERVKDEVLKEQMYKQELEHSYSELETINKELRESEKAVSVINESLEAKVKEKTKELQKLNLELQDEVEKKTQENFQQFQMLQQQSKLASMGEMIGAIAHQWRQPLNEISIRIQKLKYAYQNDEIDEAYVESFVEKNKTTIKFMSNTIDNFRNFFRIDKSKRVFDIKEGIDELVQMQSAQLHNHNIFVGIKGKTFKIEGFKTEFQQVILNLISNSKDIFAKRKVPDPQIDVYLDGNKVIVEDNGGGIPENVMDRIFEPYFTTKDQGEGTGMGLYISKMIIEQNMGGILEARNSSRGAVFIISFKEVVN